MQDEIQFLSELIATQQDTSVFLRQSQKLKILLTIPAKERDDAHLKLIAQLVQRVKFLSKYKQKPYFIELCRHLYLKTFHAKDIIFRQGDKGTSFYVILNGLVKIYAEEPTYFEGFNKKREVATLGKGNCFGEIALFFGSQRTATVIAESDSDLLMLDKDVFQQYIQDDPDAIDLQSSNLNDARRFLHQVKRFEVFSSEEITQLSTKVHKETHQQQTILIKQGSLAKQFFIIRTGSVSVIKGCGEKRYEIDYLEQGDVFSDWECLHNSVSLYTYMTNIKSEILHLNLFDVKKYISQENLTKYIEQIQLYPDTLCEMLQENQQWQQYKKQVIKNTLNDKQNSRGFNSRMRLPELRFKQIDPPEQLIFQRTFVLANGSRTPQHKKLFRREIEGLRNQISPKRMKQFEMYYL